MGTFIRVEVDEVVEVSATDPGNLTIAAMSGETEVTITVESLMEAIRILGLT